MLQPNPLPNEAISTCLALLLTKLAYMAMLFILYLMHQLQNEYIARLANLSNNRAKKMPLGLLDDREDSEYNGVGFAEISSIFLLQDSIFSWNRMI